MDRRGCHTCTHESRGQIEFLLARGVPSRQVAERFGLKKDSCARHFRNHCPGGLIAKLKARALRSIAGSNVDLESLRKEESEGLIQQVIGLRASLQGLAEQAVALGDLRCAGMLYGKITDLLGLTGRLLGEFAVHERSVTNNLVVSPDFLKLRASLLVALRPFPEAKRAVAAALSELESVEPSTTPSSDRAMSVLTSCAGSEAKSIS
jgi:hypothetical protein